MGISSSGRFTNLRRWEAWERCAGRGQRLGTVWGVLPFFFVLFFHFYFQEGLKLTLLSFWARLAGCLGFGRWGWAYRSCYVSLLWGISFQDLPLRVASDPPLPLWHFLIWVDSLPSLTRPSPFGSYSATYTGLASSYRQKTGSSVLTDSMHSISCPRRGLVGQAKHY